MILRPICCNQYASSLIGSPYMFKCERCGKELPAEIVISGRSIVEEREMYNKYLKEKHKKREIDWDD